METFDERKSTRQVQVTVGELCEALASREVPAAVEDGFYVVSRRDLRHFTEPEQKVHGLLFMELMLPQAVQIAG